MYRHWNMSGNKVQYNVKVFHHIYSAFLVFDFMELARMFLVHSLHWNKIKVVWYIAVYIHNFISFYVDFTTYLYLFKFFF
jgi:hypothetical protein